VCCDCCGCSVDVVGTCSSRCTELVRTCGHAGGGCLGEDDGVDDGAEKLLGGSIEGGEEGRGLGCGRSSGIGILLRCTVRLDGGVYVLAGESSSLMRCSPTEGLLSYTTYWCSSSDSFPVLTSAEIIRDVRLGGRNGAKKETVSSPRLCLKRFTCSTTCRTFGTSADDADRTVMNSIASSCCGINII
jgi:hypothetical protein